MKRVFDIEANGLLQDATKIWCISVYDLETRVKKHFGPTGIIKALYYLMEADVIVGHNILGYDIPLIQKLYPWFKVSGVEDTLILSRLYAPDRPNGHSLDAWGKRLGHLKPKHEDWSKYSGEMRERCDQDVMINVRVLSVLGTEGKGDWADSIHTEYDAQRLQTQIEEQGFLLDIPKAEALASELETRISQIEAELLPKLPSIVKQGTTFQTPFTKAGKLKKNLEGIPNIAGPCSKVEFIPFSFNSPKQVTSFLLSQGWEPLLFNYVKKKEGGYEINADGSYKISTPRLPKANEDQACMDSIRGEAGRLFIEHRVLTHRLGLIRRVRKRDGAKAGWLHEVRSDGRVEAQAIPLGTNTGRYTHKQIVNIPQVGTVYGSEIRSLLKVPEGYVLSGTDASGLEARVAGHYTSLHDGGLFAKELLEGDVHTKNANAFSLACNKTISRTRAKTLYYAILYGASGRKIASEASVTGDLGLKMLEAFWAENPALMMVREEATYSAKKYGWVQGLDGRKISTRSPHSALNAMFQSAGAVIMKNCFVRVGLDAKSWRFVATIHDEAQVEVLPKYTEELEKAWDEAGVWVTDKFNLNVPIEFETKLGNNYAETH